MIYTFFYLCLTALSIYIFFLLFSCSLDRPQGFSLWSWHWSEQSGRDDQQLPVKQISSFPDTNVVLGKGHMLYLLAWMLQRKLPKRGRRQGRITLGTPALGFWPFHCCKLLSHRSSEFRFRVFSPLDHLLLARLETPEYPSCEKRWIHTFPKGLNMKWNSVSSRI